MVCVMLWRHIELVKNAGKIPHDQQSRTEQDDSTIPMLKCGLPKENHFSA
jgi:hypothetical protein